MDDCDALFAAGFDRRNSLEVLRERFGGERLNLESKETG